MFEARIYSELVPLLSLPNLLSCVHFLEARVPGLSENQVVLRALKLNIIESEFHHVNEPVRRRRFT
jgi:hypothetical protein